MHHYFGKHANYFQTVRQCGLIMFVARVSGLWKLTELAFIDFCMAWEGNAASQISEQAVPIKTNQIFIQILAKALTSSRRKWLPLHQPQWQ